MTALRALNWDTLLVQWAEHIRGLPFNWGSTDCWELLRDSQCIVWGENRFAYLPKCVSVYDAREHIRAYGGMSVVLRKAGATMLPRGLARSGDIMLDPEAHDGLGAAAVVIAATQVVSVGPDGYVEVTLLRDLPPRYACWGWR